jgi:DNA (cytosine-5)-methyltransferase 1
VRYLSVCSGIEAATVAWHPLGFEPVAFSEIEKFPSQVLQHHYPHVPNLGDMTNYKEWNIEQSINILVGGTPCQSFSVAGLRKGLDDPRGNLALVYLGLAEKFKPKWIVWENVPGVLSSNGGRDFGSFLGALVELGYGFAYRVHDAQFFGVAQRRRRVFVVGCLGDWRPATAVLFDRESLSGNPSPSREKGQGITGSAEGIAGTVSSKWSKGSGGPAGDEHYNLTVAARMAAFGEYVDDGTSSTIKSRDYKDATDLVAQVYENHATDSRNKPLDQVCTTVTARWGTGGNNTPIVKKEMSVRRMTPVECERLQGFPDNYTDIKPGGRPTPDGPRYKALGNSMAVPVMRWIGERIKQVEEIK